MRSFLPRRGVWKYAQRPVHPCARYERLGASVSFGRAPRRATSSRLGVFPYAPTLLLFVLSGCSCSTESAPSVDAAIDVYMDAPLVLDAGADALDEDAMVTLVVDAGVDSGVDSGWDAGVDSGTDAAVDAGWDATDPCLTCIPEHDCDVVMCTNGVCAHSAAAEQTECVLSDSPELIAWCLDGECVEAYCGDGVVDALSDEACDDGNDVDTDACSNACAWQRFSPVEETGYSLTLRRAGAMAVDGNGVVLVAWHERAISDGPTAISVRRFTETGAALDETPRQVQSSNQGTPYPAVAGLPGGGFAFAFRMDAELYVRVLSATGQVGAARLVPNTFGVGVPSIVGVAGGFVVGWNLDGAVYAQRYSSTASALGSRITLNTSAATNQNHHSGVVFAADGDRWIAVWNRQQMPGDPVTNSVWGRRFNGGTALDATEQLYSTYGAFAAGHSVIARPGGFLLALAQFADDPSGEVYTRFVSADGVLEDAQLESFVDGATAVNEGNSLLCGYGSLGYWLGWHLGTQQLNARSVLGTRGLGLMAPPELASLNQTLQLGPWISGLSCAANAAGVWVSWESNNVVHTQLLPAPTESL